MAEAMTVESIIEGYWQLKKFFTRIRHPYFVKQEKGSGWSDIDVVAYHPKKKELVLCESKAHGGRIVIKSLN